MRLVFARERVEGDATVEVDKATQSVETAKVVLTAE